MEQKDTKVIFFNEKNGKELLYCDEVKKQQRNGCFFIIKISLFQYGIGKKPVLFSNG